MPRTSTTLVILFSYGKPVVPQFRGRIAVPALLTARDMRNRLGRGFVVGLALLIAGAQARAADPAPVELNIILPLTGQAAFAGASEQHGFRALEGVVNAQG